MLAWITGVVLAIWMMVWMYVIMNKKSIISKVTTELNNRIKGTIKIGDLDPSFISTFPHVSIRLSQVLVRDTMWAQHHHDLLKAERIYIRLGLFSLFSGSPEIKRVIINKASVYIFSDTSGFTNEYVFEGQGTPKKTKNSASPLPDIELRNVRFVMDLKGRNKLYDFDISRLSCDIKTTGSKLRLDVKTSLLVHSLAFNTNNGSFVKEQPLEGSIRLFFDRSAKKLEFKDIVLKVDDHPFSFTGMFDLKGVPPLYFLSIKTNNINFRKAASLVSNNIGKKLDSFNIKEPFNIHTTLDGRTRPNRIPLVSINVQVKNNIVSTPIGEISQASFQANFTNRLQPSIEKSDANSGFRFTGFSGTWENIPLKSDAVMVSNLKNPIMACDIHADFSLKRLNELLGSSTMEVTNGICNANLKFRGPLQANDTAVASITGKINFRDAAINYTPRNLLLTKCSGQLVFDDKDFYVKQLKAQAGTTQLLMNGKVENLTSLIDQSPEKLVLDWNITSPKLNLEDFTSFLGKRTSRTAVASKRRFLKLANQIDRMLNEGSVDLQINADRLLYKKFDASNVAANLQLTDRVVALKNVLVQHAGGSLTLNGSMKEEALHNSIALSSKMNNVNITKTLTAFNNFGQDGITDKNLKGVLSADINITGLITDKANIVENSLKGLIDFHIRDGQLINFEPVQKISQTAFKNRDFSDIRFAELKDKIEVNGSAIKVNRMEIRSTVFTMFVEGIYDVKKGTDFAIQVPLSNLSKRDEDAELRNKGVRSRTGVSLHLRAKTGEDGKAKISWDPFKRALKNKGKEVSDTLTVGRKTPTSRANR